MDTSSAEMMGAPALAENGSRLLPRRAPKGLLPSTWQGRLITVEHVVGQAVRTTAGSLADVYPTGMILLVSGQRTMISWECVCTVVLEAD
jgi:hypothetical protein